MKTCCSLVFLVIVVQQAYCGVVGKNGEAQKEVDVIEENEADNTECGLESIADGAESPNSPLLYDTNIDHHPSFDGVKHKRCHHSYSRVGASLEPRAGIVGAKAPHVVERRDRQNKFYTKACSTCMSHCDDFSNCPVCEKLCSKAAGNDEPNEVDNNVVGAPQEIPSPQEPVMSVRSNFDDDKRKNVYTITTLKEGSIKELIMQVLGVSNPEDIDTVVVWVTTRSNHPPFISRDFNGELDLAGEKAAEALKKEMKSHMQKLHQDGKKFMKEGEKGMDNAIRNILSEVNPKILGSKGVDNSEMDSRRSDMASEMLPRYPIESEPLIVPQSMNPGIIEGPPNFRTIDGESEDMDRLEASHDRVEEGSIAQFTDRTVEEGSIAQFTDRTVSLPNPSSDENQDSKHKKAQPPDFLLRAGNQPEVEYFPLDNRPRPFAANQRLETPFRGLGDSEAAGPNNSGTPLEKSVSEKFETLKKNSGIERTKDQMAPGARLREFIDNMKANIVSSKNALPNQRKFLDSTLHINKSGGLESADDAPNTLGRTHHKIGKGHGNMGHHILHPHNHRSSSQDDNIGLIYKPKEKIETTTNAPDPGPLIQKLPLPNPTDLNPDRPLTFPTTFGGMLLPPMETEISERFAEQNEDNTVGVKAKTDTQLGMGFEEQADSDNQDERSSKTSHGKGHHQVHGIGYHQGHGKMPHQGHGQVHRPRPVHGHGHFHRSSELGNLEVNPEFEREMLAEPARGDQLDSENNPVQTNSAIVSQSESLKKEPGVPVKFNVGARANELIQKLKERQEMRKASSTLQRSTSGASRNGLGGFSRNVEDAVESSIDPGTGDSQTVGAPDPFRNPDINKFEIAEAALGAVRDLSKNLQEITDAGKSSLAKMKTDKVTTKHVTDYAQQTVNTVKDESKNPNVGIKTPEMLGSQPLENSLERIQPSMSLSGRPWRNQNSASKALINEPKNELLEKPSLGSANQNLNGIAELEMVGESNPGMNTRGQFEGDQRSYSDSMGAIIPVESPNDSSHTKSSDVYFLGNGIKLPIIMAKGEDGVLHLSVDLDKLCSCNNITCPKNHTVLEKAVETILENEADGLKQQLEPMELVSKGIDPSNMQEDYGDMPLGMASPQGSFGDYPSDLEERVEMQPRMGAFDDDAMEDGKEEQMALPHRNQRDTDEESRFLYRKNKVTGDFDSMELLSDNNEVLEKSTEVKAVKSGTKSLHVPMKKIAASSTRDPKKPEFKQRQQNLLSKNIRLNDGAHVSGDTKEKVTKTNILSESTTKTGEDTTKVSSSEPNYLQNFMNNRLDDIRSKLEIRNEDMKKDLSFPEYFFKNLWAAGKEQADKIASNLNANNPSPTLGSRLGSLFGKTAAVNNEVYENLAPITKPYKFKALENQLKSNLEHIGDTVDNYTKRDDEILKEEVAALDKITKNPVVKKEVGIVSNILKFLKDLAADKNKRK